MSVNIVTTRRPHGRKADKTRTRSPRNTLPTSTTPTASIPTSAPVTPIMPLAYSLAEARKVLSLSHYSLYQLIDSGALKSIAVGGSSKRAGRRIIPLAAIQEYLTRELAAQSAQNGQSGEGREDGGRHGAA